MKEQWMIEAEQNAKTQAKSICINIIDKADILCVDREWYFEKVIQYMKAESENEK